MTNVEQGMSNVEVTAAATAADTEPRPKRLLAVAMMIAALSGGKVEMPSMKGLPGGPVGTPAPIVPGRRRTPRNARCPCGSGKKYKRCHGKP